jgi:D-serine deaminase-like pyridoxal phosphate-dependent protein
VLRAEGHGIDVVSVGSTPGWDSAPTVAGVTEARPGTYVFFDANQFRLRSTELDRCALTVRSSVVSAPRPGEVIIDAGIKAMSSDRSNRGDTLGIVLTPDGAPVPDVEFSRGYEEHGVLEGVGTGDWSVGDALRILPNHACGVVNMWSRVVVAEDGVVLDSWTPQARH